MDIIIGTYRTHDDWRRFVFALDVGSSYLYTYYNVTADFGLETVATAGGYFSTYMVYTII